METKIVKVVASEKVLGGSHSSPAQRLEAAVVLEDSSGQRYEVHGTELIPKGIRGGAEVEAHIEGGKVTAIRLIK